ncbi:MAG: hypothetical protein H6739_36915 [Alphaproteobacteria bacterium]|nr:hypothetical protein [Alphaproteobacteria bacterium]
MFALLLLACTGDDPAVDDSAATDDTGEVVDTAPQPPTPAAYSGGTCPTLEAGWNDAFLSADVERRFNLVLPPDPDGAGVLFVFHWLGGSAAQFLNYTPVADLAEQNDLILVVPDSCCGAFEWPFTPNEDPTPDLTFFDDALSCLSEQHSVDLSRVYATGMSAGGLWTSFLTMHRAEALAATAPLSGGTEGAMLWTEPARPLPVLLTWGGENDTFGSGGTQLSFHDANLAFSADLTESGSWVGHCVHDLGHDIHPDSIDYLATFFGDHVWGQPSPYADGFPSSFPDWCGLPGEVW